MAEIRRRLKPGSGGRVVLGQSVSVGTRLQRSVPARVLAPDRSVLAELGPGEEYVVEECAGGDCEDDIGNVYWFTPVDGEICEMGLDGQSYTVGGGFCDNFPLIGVVTAASDQTLHPRCCAGPVTWTVEYSHPSGETDPAAHGIEVTVLGGAVVVDNAWAVLWGDADGGTLTLTAHCGTVVIGTLTATYQNMN